MQSSKSSRANLKNKLEYHYKYFDKTKISPDPLEFPHRFNNFFDIEISAFISATLAYGSVKQINNSLEKIHSLMKNKPYEFIKKYNYKKGIELFKTVKHRFYTEEDIANLFYILQNVYSAYGSLKILFLLYYFPASENLKDSISFFSNNLINLSIAPKNPSAGIKFMFPDPHKGSACKRMNLFLRWMVRKDELDFGIWSEIKKTQLLIPVDTHVAAICKELKLTKRKTASWEMAEEVTSNLKKYDLHDPVKYDFAICHIGMRKLVF